MSATMNPSEPGQEFLFNYAADIRPLITPEYCSEFLLQFETFATWEHAHLMPVCAEYDGPGLRISLPPAEAPSDISSLNFAIFSGTFPRGSSWIWNNGFVGEVSFGGDGVRSELTQTDGKPPEILKVDGSHIQVKVEIIYSYLIPKESKVKITVEAHDAAGLDRFEFILQGEEIKQVFVTDGSLEKTVSVTFTCGVGRALGRGWDLEVKVYDRNGNGNRTSTHIDGALEGVVKALIKAFMALVEAIKELASKVFDWIWETIRNIINTVMKPINDSINNFKDLLFNTINGFIILIQNIVGTGTGRSTTNIISNKIFSNLFSNPIYFTLSAMSIALLAVQVLVTIFTAGVGGIILEVATTFISEIISQAISAGSKSGIILSVDPMSSFIYGISLIASSFLNPDIRTANDVINKIFIILGIITAYLAWKNFELVTKGKINEAKSEIDEYEYRIQIFIKLIKDPTQASFKEELKKHLKADEKEMASKKGAIMNFEEALENEKSSTYKSIAFGVFGLIINILALCLHSIKKELTMFGFGFSITAFLFSLYVLGHTTGSRFLVGIGSALNLIGTISNGIAVANLWSNKSEKKEG